MSFLSAREPAAAQRLRQAFKCGSFAHFETDIPTVLRKIAIAKWCAGAKRS